MAAKFVIPSYFTAIDKMTKPMQQMARSVSAFSATATQNVTSFSRRAVVGMNNWIGVSESGIARQERMFRRFTPVLSEASKNMLSYAKAAAVAGGATALVAFSASQVRAFESAVASFRTIVSDLSDQEFVKFRAGIMDVAKTTRTSSVDVVQSFEKIAGLNASFAETAEGLSAVSKAAIIMSRASGDTLESSAESLVGIMNQFSLTADQADRTINVLAAGQAVGAASITQTAEAFKNFGSVAAGANITLEQSVGLIQTLGQFSVFGAEAGTKLRGAILKLQKAGLGYKSGQFQINDALVEANQRIERLGSAKAKDAALNKMFGAENISTGRILLANVELFKQFTEGVSGTSEAHKAASINSDTLNNRLKELGAAWTNIITGSDGAGQSLSYAKRVIVLLTDNLETIVNVGARVLTFFIAWKALILLSKAALVAYNVVMGVAIALQGKSAFAVMGNVVAYKAYRAAVLVATAAQWAWNVAMNANPIGILITLIGGLILLTIAAAKNWDKWGESLAFWLGPFGMIISLVQSFRRNWELIEKAFKEGGIVSGLKMIGKTILDAVLSPIQRVLELLSKLPKSLGGGIAADAAKSLESFRRGMGVDMTRENERYRQANPGVYSPAIRQAQVISASAIHGLPALDRRNAEQQVSRTETIDHSRISIDVNDPNRRTTVRSDNPAIPINVTPTFG